MLHSGALDYVTDLKDGNIRRVTTQFTPEKIAELTQHIQLFAESLRDLYFPEEPIISTT